jgi:2'-5' RNA ligase
VARLFVAVWPTAALLDQLQALERVTQPGLRWTTEGQWHVTLRFFGSLDAVGETAARSGLDEATAGAPAVEVDAGPAACALNRTVWVLPVDGLEALAERIADATRAIGDPPPRRRFQGHVTLARARRPGVLSALPSTPVSGRWTVKEVTLVRSDLRPDGARYHVIDRWPLGQAGGGD